jgi:hypothetical protein
MKVESCPSCARPLIEIDNGELLFGCVECNRWTWRDSETISMSLPEDDLEALRKRVKHG